MNYFLISKIKWDKKNYKNLSKKIIFSHNVNILKINKINPKIIFFLHWSKRIPKSLYNKFTCIQFHASDLPKFRGGSPIQNQIICGKQSTKISAFKVTDKIDSGDICLKKNLSLKGNVQDIFVRLEKKAISMINELILLKKIKFKKQKGVVSFFKRRSPEQSNLLNSNLESINEIYNFIRMLDSKEYPNANINLNKYKIIFNNAILKNNTINGNFKIIKK